MIAHLSHWSLGLSILVATTGGAFALASAWLFVQALAALAYREPPVHEAGARLTVLIPAHNESALITRCVQSLRRQDYPFDLVRLVVVADNCTDDTARLADEAGAEVLIRTDGDRKGKGYALRWAMDSEIAGPHRPDAFVIVDGDSVAFPSLLSALASRYEDGAQVVQADYVVEDQPSPRVRLRAAAFLLFHRVRFAGRAMFHLPCSLVGNGMLLSAALIRRTPWNAYSGAEDLEYSVTLRLAGERPVFCLGGRVAGPVPTSRQAVQVQRERWEGGRLHVVRTSGPTILREVVIGRRGSLVDLLLDITMPPLGVLTLGALGGAALAVLFLLIGAAPLWGLWPWVVALVLLSLYVATGLRASGAPLSTYTALLAVPVFLAEKVLGLTGVLRSRPTEVWVRTERPGESG